MTIYFPNPCHTECCSSVVSTVALHQQNDGMACHAAMTKDALNKVDIHSTEYISTCIRVKL